MQQAFIELQKNYSAVSLGYIAMHETHPEQSYVQARIDEKLIASYMQGNKMPSGESVVVDAPDDLMDSIPPAPTLNKLVLIGVDSNALAVPVAVVEDLFFSGRRWWTELLFVLSGAPGVERPQGMQSGVRIVAGKVPSIIHHRRQNRRHPSHTQQEKAR